MSIVFAHQLAESGATPDPKKALREAIAFSSMDWGAARDTAWIYGIVVGWDSDDDDDDDDDGAMEHLAGRFGWTPQKVQRLRDLHDAFNA